MKIQLYWEDFYEQMEKMGMNDEYDSFEKILVDMFRKQFKIKRVVIDWMD